MSFEQITPVSGGCPATKSACLCLHEQGHEGPHVCNCGGSWGDDGTVYRMPQTGMPDLDEANEILRQLLQ